MKQLGVIVPIVTPCSKDGQVDVNGLQAVCDDMMQAGCHGIFVNGSTGRGPWFTRNKRIQICTTIAGRLDKEVPLLAGCMAAGLEDMLDNAKAMADAGATMAVVTAPMYFPYSVLELEAIFLAFADASPIPVIIYDIPELAGTGLKPELLLKLATHENVVGFKDSSANYETFKQLLDTLNTTKPDFYLMQGKEHLLKDSLQAGASGLVVSMLHVDPRPYVKLYAAVQDGDMKTADKMQASISEMFYCFKKCLEQTGSFSTLIHFMNTTLNERGINVNLSLAHEGECPTWVAEKAKDTLRIAKEALNNL